MDFGRKLVIGMFRVMEEAGVLKRVGKDSKCLGRGLRLERF